MATQEKTRRQAERDVAAAEEERLRIERDRLGEQVSRLEADIARLQGEREQLEAEIEVGLREELATGTSFATQAKRHRARIARIEDELPHLRDLRQAAFDQLHRGAFQAHGEAFRAAQEAQRALRREPCELALLEVDRLMREVERAWEAAGVQVRQLAAANDAWGESELSRLLVGFRNVTPDGNKYRISLPHFPAEGA
jgi:chromosome segregation ATPase